MSAETVLQGILYNDATLQGLLSSFTLSATDYYMCFSGSVLPKTVNTDSGTQELKIYDSTVNHYRSGSTGGGTVYLNTTHSISCRAYDIDTPLGEDKARQIQQACYAALGGTSGLISGGYQFVPTKLPTIKPADDNDNWNAPIDIVVRGNNC